MPRERESSGEPNGTQHRCYQVYEVYQRYIRILLGLLCIPPVTLHAEFVCGVRIIGEQLAKLPAYGILTSDVVACFLWLDTHFEALW